MKGGPFGLARYGILRGKTGKTFLVQFARPNSAICAIKFCRTFKNYFGQFVWIEKKSHYNSRVSLHEAPTEKRRGTIVAESSHTVTLENQRGQQVISK